MGVISFRHTVVSILIIVWTIQSTFAFSLVGPGKSTRIAKGEIVGGKWRLGTFNRDKSRKPCVLLVQEDDNLQIAEFDNSSSDPSTSRKELRFGPFGSLEVLAVVVSLFFVATVMLTGDALFAKPSTTASRLPTIDAEEVLQNDFMRIDSSVPFSSSN